MLGKAVIVSLGGERLHRLAGRTRIAPPHHKICGRNFPLYSFEFIVSEKKMGMIILVALRAHHTPASNL
jgi:hypothetical protein